MSRRGWMLVVLALALERAAFDLAGDRTIDFALAWSAGRPLPWLTDFIAIVLPFVALGLGAACIVRVGARLVAMGSGALLSLGWALASWQVLPPLSLALIALGRGGLRPALVVAMAELVWTPGRRADTGDGPPKESRSNGTWRSRSRTVSMPSRPSFNRSALVTRGTSFTGESRLNGSVTPYRIDHRAGTAC